MAPPGDTLPWPHLFRGSADLEPVADLRETPAGALLARLTLRGGSADSEPATESTPVSHRGLPMANESRIRSIPMTPTPKQLAILVAIRDFRVQHGYSPTMQELADQLDVSKVTIFEHVEALERKASSSCVPGTGLALWKLRRR